MLLPFEVGIGAGDQGQPLPKKVNCDRIGEHGTTMLVVSLTIEGVTRSRKRSGPDDRVATPVGAIAPDRRGATDCLAQRLIEEVRIGNGRLLPLLRHPGPKSSCRQPDPGHLLVPTWCARRQACTRDGAGSRRTSSRSASRGQADRRREGLQAGQEWVTKSASSVTKSVTTGRRSGGKISSKETDWRRSS
jgi:hypothetical protein